MLAKIHPAEKNERCFKLVGGTPKRRFCYGMKPCAKHKDGKAAFFEPEGASRWYIPSKDIKDAGPAYYVSPNLLDAEILPQYRQSVQGEALTTYLWADHLVAMKNDYDSAHSRGVLKEEECDEAEDGDGDGSNVEESGSGAAKVEDMGFVSVLDQLVEHDARRYTPTQGTVVTDPVMEFDVDTQVSNGPALATTRAAIMDLVLTMRNMAADAPSEGIQVAEHISGNLDDFC